MQTFKGSSWLLTKIDWLLIFVTVWLSIPLNMNATVVCQGQCVVEFYSASGNIRERDSFPFDVTINNGNSWKINVLESGTISWVVMHQAEGTAIIPEVDAANRRLPVFLWQPGFPLRGYHMQIPWLATVGLKYLTTNFDVPAPWMPPLSFPAAHIFKPRVDTTNIDGIATHITFLADKDKIESAPNSPFLLREGQIQGQVRGFERFIPPCPSGFIGAVFSVTGIDKLDDVCVASEFRMVVNFPSFVRAQNPRVDCVFTGRITNIFKTGEPISYATPPHGYGILDYRFHDQDHAVDFIRYNSTNIFTAKTDSNLLAMFREKIRRQPLTSQPISKRTIVLGLFGLSFIFLPVIIWRHLAEQRKQIANKTKTEGLL